MRLISTLLCAVLWFTSAKADPATWTSEGWKTDFQKSSVQWNEILSGGPPRDGIPALDAPKFMPIGSVSDVADNEPVIGLDVNGEAKAYPLSVLMWHEIANDLIGGQPVAVTYCPLCNAAIVFDRTHKGQTLDFGTTGKLRNSDLIMYDRQTESWWQQFTGEAIVGAMLGESLKIIPSRLESFADFKSRFPKGLVLVPNNINMRSYGSNPYVGYDTLAKPFLYDGSLPEGIEPMARVIVVRENNKPLFILSLEKLRKAETLKRDGYDLTWKAGQASVLDTGAIAKGRDIGSITVSKLGKDAAYDVTFAFVAHAFHPGLPIEQ